MNGIDILQIATATIISAGGIGAIIIAAVQFTSNIIADKISKKYELKLNESLESYKSNLDKGNPIEEIHIYNPKLEELAKDIRDGKRVTEVQMDTLKSNIAEQFLEFKKVLDESESFINGEIYSKYAKLYDLIRSYYLNEDSMLLDEIQSLRLQLPKTIRNYLIGLTVIN